MGIKVEFNTDLTLRAHGTEDRSRIECLPKVLKKGDTYRFLKEEQRIYNIEDKIPLKETTGNQQVSQTLVEITIIELTHFIHDKKPYTKVFYRIIETYPEGEKKNVENLGFFEKITGR